VKTGEHLPRMLAAVFVVCAIFMQGYAVQTHIHGLPAAVQSFVTHSTVRFGATSQGHAGNRQGPAQDDPDSCPLCQAASHVNGAFLAAPSAIAPFSVYFQPNILHFVQAFSAPFSGHDEEQRGPPLPRFTSPGSTLLP
jgi:hypothetical protein